MTDDEEEYLPFDGRCAFETLLTESQRDRVLKSSVSRSARSSTYPAVTANEEKARARAITKCRREQYDLGLLSTFDKLRKVLLLPPPLHRPLRLRLLFFLAVYASCFRLPCSLSPQHRSTGTSTALWYKEGVACTIESAIRTIALA